MNKVSLVGRLARDPEVRYSQGENSMAIARFTLAVNRRFKHDEADFISCLAFGKSGEFAEKYLRKGMRIGLCGRIQTGSYTNKDGQKVYTTEVVVEEMEFVESKSNNQGGSGNNSGQNRGNQSPNNNNYNSSPAPNESGYQNSGMGGNDGFMNIPDGLEDELPFS